MVVVVVWKGWGFLVVLLAIGCPWGLSELADNYIGAGHTMKYGWPLSAGLAIAAALTGLLGRWLNFNRIGDKEHDLFFVPMEYYGLVLGAVAVICQVVWWI